jgi:hypothetical protein
VTWYFIGLLGYWVTKFINAGIRVKNKSVNFENSPFVNFLGRQTFYLSVLMELGLTISLVS